MGTFAAVNVGPHWARLNDHLIELVNCIPDDKLEWSPRPEQWNARGMLLHIVGARHHWLENAVHDGEETPDILAGGKTKDGVQEQLRLSWERLARFLSDSAKLAALYEPAPFDPRYADEPDVFDGHYIAYHRLVHDAHHRADLIHLLGAAGVALPEERRRRPL
jgi:uncharacterized damage-inducible protein DinB